MLSNLISKTSCALLIYEFWVFYSTLRPHSGFEGVWTSPKSCGRNLFLKGVAIKTQTKQGLKDDRGATDVKFFCSDGEELQSTASQIGKHRYVSISLVVWMEIILFKFYFCSGLFLLLYLQYKRCS